MAAKVMLAKHSGNVGNHSFEFLGWDKPPTPGISGGHAPLIIRGSLMARPLHAVVLGAPRII